MVECSLRRVNKDSNKSFKDLLKRDNSIAAHYGNIKSLAI